MLNILFYWIAIPYGLVLMGDILDSHLPLPFSLDASLFSVFGSVTMTLGLILSVWATSYFLVDGLGFPISAIPPKRLVRCGPYSFVRHPVYIGFMLFTIGLSLLVRSEWCFVSSLLLSSLIVFYTLSLEEKKLSEIYGKEYDEYRRSVGAFLPLGRYRSSNCPPPLYVFFYTFGHFVMPLFYKVDVEKRCEVPLRGVVLVSNHVSYLDFAFLLYAVKGYARFPISSQHFRKHEKFYRSVGCFPIKRYAPDMKAIRNMVKILSEGGRVGIFPEAERSWDGRFLGFKEGFDRLILKFPKPYIGVRLEKVHLYFPRWSRKFRRGRIRVVIDSFNDVEELKEFLSKPSVNEEDVYPSYEGIEYYLYLCPKCGRMMSLKGSKDRVKCENCDFELIKPKVGKLWEIHDELKSHLSLPLEEDVILLDEDGKKGERSKIRLDSFGNLIIGERKMNLSELKSMIVEGVKDIYLFDGEKLIGFKLLKSSALMWQEVISDMAVSLNLSFQTR